MKSGYVGEDAQDLIHRMLTVDPRKRIDLHGIIHHAWMKGFRVDESSLPTEFVIDEKIVS
jgi:serine/threonine protein kinase